MLQQQKETRTQVLAISYNYTRYVWGFGVGGRLGMGDESSQLSPVIPAGLAGKVVTQVSLSDNHTVLLTNEGQVFTFGLGNYGQLGHGNFETLLTPTRIRGPLAKVRVIAVAAGAFHTVVLVENSSTSQSEYTEALLQWYKWQKAEFEEVSKHQSSEQNQTPFPIPVYSWGCCNHGQLGLGTMEKRCTPAQVFLRAHLDKSCANITKIATGAIHTLLLTENGLVLQAGFGTPSFKLVSIFEEESLEVDGFTTPTPAKPRHARVDDITCGGGRALALSSGKLFIWGCSTASLSATSSSQAPVRKTMSQEFPVIKVTEDQREPKLVTFLFHHMISGMAISDSRIALITGLGTLHIANIPQVEDCQIVKPAFQRAQISGVQSVSLSDKACLTIISSLPPPPSISIASEFANDCRNMLEDNFFTDITLKTCEGASIRAHRIFVSRSPWINNCLTNASSTECILPFARTLEDLKYIKTFLYTNMWQTDIPNSFVQQLRMDQNCPSIADYLLDTFKCGNLYDITLRSTGAPIKAHRVILAYRSEYFHAMLLGGLRESSGSSTSVDLPDIPRPHLVPMLEFLYSDQISPEVNRSLESRLELAVIASQVTHPFILSYSIADAASIN